MKWMPFVLALPLAGCLGDDFELDLSDGGPATDIYSEGSTVRVRACTQQAFLGCAPEPVDSVLVVTVDGATYQSSRNEVQSTGEIDELMSLFGPGNLRVEAPAPTDRMVGIELSGYAFDVALPAPFAVLAPDHVTRGAGPIGVAFEPIMGGSASFALVTSQCGRDSYLTMVDVPVDETTGLPTGRIELELADVASAGPCTHTLQIDQAYMSTPRVINVVKSTFTSEP